MCSCDCSPWVCSSDLVFSVRIITTGRSSCFCFKQKTAYEMRISDWSSDLCSSDLLGYGLGLDACAVTGGTADLVWVSPRSGRAVSREEIGRASGRERVCESM